MSSKVFTSKTLVALCLLLVFMSAPKAHALLVMQGNFGTPKTFDALDALHNDAHKYKDNSDGGLAWSESYIMMSYVTMYQATEDTKYLNKLISHADTVLANRDNLRGIIDYRGISHPGWAAAGSYSIGEINLLDQAGHPTLYLSVASTGSNHITRVTVTAAATPGRFNLQLQNTTNKYNQTFHDLSMNKADARYVVKVLSSSSLAAPTGAVRLKVQDLNSASPGELSAPVPIDTNMHAPYYLWPVHQGMITYPMVAFARLIKESPALQANATFAAKADYYVQEVEKLMLVLEEDWHENELGEGWYAVAQGAPVWMDGVDEPFNHFLAVGRTMVALAAVTDNPLWCDRVVKMATTFKNDLKLKNGGYTWQYWWSKGYGSKGWTPAQGISLNTPGLSGRKVAEDISHGSIDIHFAYLCYLDGIVFNREDMQRFAQTFTQLMLSKQVDGTPTLFQRVDGTGPLGTYDIYARHNVLFAQFDPTILDVYEAMYAKTEWKSNTMYMLTAANMNLVKKTLAEQAP